MNGSFRLDAHHGVAARIERHRRDDRNCRCGLSDALDRSADLLEIGHRLNPDDVHATGDQGGRLLGKDIDGLVEIEAPERHHDRAGRADVAGHQGVGPGGLDLGSEQQCRHLVELRNAVLVAVQAHTKAIAAERVGQHDAGTGVEIAPMNTPDHVRLGQVPELGRITELETGREQHGAHGAIGERRCAGVQNRVPAGALNGRRDGARSPLLWNFVVGHRCMLRALGSSVVSLTERLPPSGRRAAHD